MSALLSLTCPLLLAFALAAATAGGQDAYRALTAGAQKGLSVVAALFPALLALFPAIALLRATPLPEQLCRALAPLLERLGIPEETGLLLLLRPLSGSAALAEAGRLIAAAGPDSLPGRTAAVMLGSSETTFYVTAVYFSAAGIRDSRWAIPAALCADLACFLSAAWVSRLFWG